MPLPADCVGSGSPAQATGALVLADGTVFEGAGFGATGQMVGELCFNTAISGYQEILTDPSYAGQLITFTFPHIGNVGTNPEDLEAMTPVARGLILREAPTSPANWRSLQPLARWLSAHGIIGLAGVDTRALTRRIRDGGAPRAALLHAPGGMDLVKAQAAARAWPGLEGMDLAREVTTRQSYVWDETPWRHDGGHGRLTTPRYRVVAIDYGAKRNILRMLAHQGCAVTVVPATASLDEVLSHQPDGVFLSNGPGDPEPVAAYAVPVIEGLLHRAIPLFGICLGYQLMALAVGGRTVKMARGHRGANHPVKNLVTGRVEITSQNHGFAVDGARLPADLTLTHISLFDGSTEGFDLTGKPAFAVQYHPEASPGPHDSHYLFGRFAAMMDQHIIDRDRN